MTSNQGLNIYYEGTQYKDGKIDIKEFAPSLLALGEIGYSNKKNGTITKITNEHKEAILAPDKNRERTTQSQDPIKTNLIVRIVDFYGDQKWTFMYAGKTLKSQEVEYSELIKEKLKEINKNVTYNSKLPVEMIITYEVDNGEAIEGTQKYKTQQITGELIQQAKQAGLFNQTSSTLH